MNELKIERQFPESSIRRAVQELARDFEGVMAPPLPGGASFTFGIRHRFFSGELTASVHWRPEGEGILLRAEVDDSAAGLSRAGRGLLVLGALATLPPILCWYLPSLMPLVPLSLLLALLTWLGVVRKPAYYSPEFYLRRLQTELSRLETEEGQAEG